MQPEPMTDDESRAERAVADYLRDHPDFFSRHLDLLEILRLPHPCHPAASLIERQLLLLRGQNGQLRKRFRELVKIARENDCLSDRMQQLNLALIEAREVGDMVTAVQCVLREEFSADFTALGLTPLGGGASLWPDDCDWPALGVELGPLELELFAPVFSSGRPLCGRLTSRQVECLFADAATEVASIALVPLSGFEWKGLIGIGSRDSERFHPGIGTLFLSRIGELISHALQSHINMMTLDGRPDRFGRREPQAS